MASESKAAEIPPPGRSYTSSIKNAATPEKVEEILNTVAPNSFVHLGLMSGRPYMTEYAIDDIPVTSKPGNLGALFDMCQPNQYTSTLQQQDHPLLTYLWETTEGKPQYHAINIDRDFKFEAMPAALMGSLLPAEDDVVDMQTLIWKAHNEWPTSLGTTYADLWLSRNEWPTVYHSVGGDKTYHTVNAELSASVCWDRDKEFEEMLNRVCTERRLKLIMANIGIVKWVSPLLEGDWNRAVDMRIKTWKPDWFPNYEFMTYREFETLQAK